MEKKSISRIDDGVARAIEAYQQDLEPFVGRESLNAAIAAVPYIGSVILSLTNDVATRRSYERGIELFKLMKEQFERIDHSKLDKEFFKTEEFQTLLFLGFEQLRTTHDKTKQKMLATALSNSGSVQFSCEERKELFVRILRDLSSQHVQVLKMLIPSESVKDSPVDSWPTESSPVEERLGVLKYLSAMGLVHESLSYDKNRSFGGPRYSNTWSAADAERAIKEYVNVTPKQKFRITQFGLDFLRFMGN